MSDIYHSEPFQCGDPAGLVSYLYDECRPGERDVIAAHVASCILCAEELATLGATRTQLTAWTPPEAAIGFQITSTARASDGSPDVERSPGGRVLRPARWWSQPLPAWAQIAAGVLLFASGMAIGVVRPGAGLEPVATSTPAAPVAASTPAPGVSPRDLQDLERRLRGEIAQTRTTAAAAAVARTGDADVLKRVQVLIADSEQRQRRELALRTTELVRDMDTQRRVDFAQVQRNLGQIQDLTGAAVRDQNDMFNYLVKVSQRGR